jgi:hypothetical protein
VVTAKRIAKAGGTALVVALLTVGGLLILDRDSGPPLARNSPPGEASECEGVEDKLAALEKIESVARDQKLDQVSEARGELERIGLECQ